MFYVPVNYFNKVGTFICLSLRRSRNSCQGDPDDLFLNFDNQCIIQTAVWMYSKKVSNGAKIRNRYNQVPHLTQDTNGKVTNSQKTPQTRAKRSSLSQQVTNWKQLDSRVECISKGCVPVFVPQHEISNNVVCETNKGSDQPAHLRSLIRAFASRFNILCQATD